MCDLCHLQRIIIFPYDMIVKIEVVLNNEFFFGIFLGCIGDFIFTSLVSSIMACFLERHLVNTFGRRGSSLDRKRVSRFRSLCLCSKCYEITILNFNIAFILYLPFSPFCVVSFLDKFLVEAMLSSLYYSKFIGCPLPHCFI